MAEMAGQVHDSSEGKGIPQKGSDRPRLKYLSRHAVKFIGSKWFTVGLELFGDTTDDEHELNLISGDTSFCAMEVLKKWLEKKKGSWNDLIKALRTVELIFAADQIEEMLIPEVSANDPIQQGIKTVLDYKSDVSTKDYTAQEAQTELLKQSQMVSDRILPPEHVSTDATPYSTGHNVTQKSVNTVSATGSQSTGSATNYLQANNDMKIKGSKSKKSTSVYETVLQYYSGRFVNKWMCETKSDTIDSLAALLIERDDEMRVVVLTTGTTHKRECSYLLNNGSIDECMWGQCDAHPESLCYRFAIFYLITEMHRYQKDTNKSILKMQTGGFALKEDIKLHFFSRNVPCGFMENKDCFPLSWKTPFNGKPHCLECSSLILISAYLGIQGPLSHLFSKPVYISSITIAKCKDAAASKAAEIKEYFKCFSLLLKDTDRNAPDRYYKFNIPNVEIADVEIADVELFPGYFGPCDDEFQGEKQAENKIIQTASIVQDTEDNVMNYTLNSKIGNDDFRKKMISRLKNLSDSDDFKKEIKKIQLCALEKAQERLFIALNAGEALEKLKSSLIKNMDNELSKYYQSGSKIEQCRSTTNKLIVLVNKYKDLLCNPMKIIESDCDINTPTREFLGLLRQEIETDLQSLIETMNKLEIKNNLLVDIFNEYCGYKGTCNFQDVLKKDDISGWNSQSLMGCDWARYLVVIDHDIQEKLDETIHTSLPAPMVTEIPERRDAKVVNGQNQQVNLDINKPMSHLSHQQQLFASGNETVSDEDCTVSDEDSAHDKDSAMVTQFTERKIYHTVHSCLHRSKMKCNLCDTPEECQNNYDDEFASRFQQFLDKDLNISANNEDATSNFLKCIEIHLQAKNCPSPCSRLWRYCIDNKLFSLLKYAPEGLLIHSHSRMDLVGTIRKTYFGYRSVNLIGHGGFGNIYKYSDQIAIKEEHKCPLITGSTLLFQRIMKLNHPHVIKVLEYITGPYNNNGRKCFLFVMSFMNREDLRKQFTKEKHLTCLLDYMTVFHNQKKFIFRNYTVLFRHVFEGLCYLKSQGIIHRDIKCSNILVHQYCGCQSPLQCTCAGDGGVTYLLGDMDLFSLDANSRYTVNEWQKMSYHDPAGTMGMKPPEAFFRTKKGEYVITHKSDVWSACVTMMNVLIGKGGNEGDLQQISMFMAAATRGTKAAFKDIIDSSNVVESMTTKLKKIKQDSSGLMMNETITSDLSNLTKLQQLLSGGAESLRQSQSFQGGFCEVYKEENPLARILTTAYVATSLHWKCLSKLQEIYNTQLWTVMAQTIDVLVAGIKFLPDNREEATEIIERLKEIPSVDCSDDEQRTINN